MVASNPTTELSIDASSLPIETVTVYQPSGAQVIRTLEVNLKVSKVEFDSCSPQSLYGGQAGTNVIRVANLSSSTETESFRVDGLGNARLLVVQCILDRYPEIPKSDPIRDLTSQLNEIQTEKNAREQEVAILKRFGESMAGKPDLSPDQAHTFSGTVFDKILTCAETVRELNEKVVRLNQKINKMQSSKRGEAFTKAIITVLAGEDGPVQLRLIYREGSCHPLKLVTHPLRAGVLGAYWHPLYDLYTTSDNGKPSTTVSLHYRVNLQQHTGEDWTNAKLVLSTSATDVLNAGIPKPDHLVVGAPTAPPASDIYSPESPCFSLASPQASAASEVSEDEDMAFDLSCDASIPPPTKMIMRSAAVVSKSPMAISYTVEALTTIPSDGISYKVLVATIPFEAFVTYITTPRRLPITYLQVISVPLSWASG